MGTQRPITGPITVEEMAGGLPPNQQAPVAQPTIPNFREDFDPEGLQERWQNLEAEPYAPPEVKEDWEGRYQRPSEGVLAEFHRRLSGSGTLTTKKLFKVIDDVTSWANPDSVQYADFLQKRMMETVKREGLDKTAKAELSRLAQNEEQFRTTAASISAQRKMGITPAREQSPEEKQKMDLASEGMKAEAGRSRAEKTISELVKKTPGTALGYDMDGNPKMIPASLLTMSDSALLANYKIVRATPRDVTTETTPPAAQSTAPVGPLPNVPVVLTSPDGTRRKMFSDPAMIRQAQQLGWR